MLFTIIILIVKFSIILPENNNSPRIITIQDITPNGVYATYTQNNVCHRIVFIPFNESTTYGVHEDFYDTNENNEIIVDFEQDEYGKYNDIFWYKGIDFAMLDLGNCENAPTTSQGPF